MTHTAGTRIITSTYIGLVDGSHFRDASAGAGFDDTHALVLRSGDNNGSITVSGTRDQLRHLAKSILGCTETMTPTGEEPARCICCREAPCTPGRTMCEECCAGGCDPEYACELPMLEREASGL